MTKPLGYAVSNSRIPVSVFGLLGWPHTLFGPRAQPFKMSHGRSRTKGERDTGKA